MTTEELEAAFIAANEFETADVSIIVFAREIEAGSV